MKNKEVKKTKEDYQKTPKPKYKEKKCLRCNRKVKLPENFFMCPRCRGYSEVYCEEFGLNL